MRTPWMKLALSAGYLVTVSLVQVPAVVAADRSREAVDALQAVFGKHNARASYAKGQCVTGRFVPTAEAAKLTHSLAFAGPSKVLGRFSMGGGSPTIPDATKLQVRGFAFTIDPDGPGDTEFALNTAPVQFASTLEQWLGYLAARVPGADGKPDPEKIKAFAEAYPHSKRQAAWLGSRPVPASYASVNYWAVHAYSMTNAKGATQVVKFKLVPSQGEVGLSDDEAKAKPNDFLVDELKSRTAKGLADFDFIAVPGRPGDATNDPATQWADEETRTPIKLGRLSVTALADNEICDATTFDAHNLADGLDGPADDPLFAARSTAYAVSRDRRR